ncbi:uncharacterized protein [Symphalangus syndactylus]|uniref:uncharacterized protein isoform X2 n=1 Tax=Symphalangus syndactylus TaxID=9590 RepID=UPI003005F343
MSKRTHQYRSTPACWQAVDQRKNAEFVRGGQRGVRPPYLTPGENRLPSGSLVCRELLPLNKTFHSFFKPTCDPVLLVHQGSHSIPGLECSGTITAHHSLDLLGSGDPPALVSQVAGTTVLVMMYTWQLTVKSYEGLKHKVCIKGQNSHKPAQIRKEGTEMEPLHGRKFLLKHQNRGKVLWRPSATLFSNGVLDHP